MSETGKKRLNLFERYLTIWVVLCMAAGIVLVSMAAIGYSTSSSSPSRC